MNIPLRFFAAVITAVFVFSAVTGSAAAGRSRPPNVALLLLDNIGQEWFGCYGSEENCTPNIDRLAKEGVRFAHVYTPPVCGPSRVELMTGRYPFRTGWYLHHDAGLYGGGGFDWRREVTHRHRGEMAGQQPLRRARRARAARLRRVAGLAGQRRPRQGSVQFRAALPARHRGERRGLPPGRHARYREPLLGSRRAAQWPP